MKNSYILLRNNKETGPYSLNELQDHGLKPGDLVWVEGQSVAWLHPGEIPDLKALPVNSVEKPAPVIEHSVYEAVEVKEEMPVLAQQTEINRKSVFVSMPVNKIMKKEAGEKKAPAFSSIEDKQEESPVAVTKYSQPLEEIKEMYVKTLQQRKQKMARKNTFRKRLKSGSLIVGLLVLGVLIGLTLKKGTGKKSAVAAIQQQQPPVQNNSAPETISINPDQLISQPQAETVLTNQQPENLPQEETTKQTEKEITSVTAKRNVAAKKEITPVENTDGAGTTDINGERTSKVRNDAAETTKAPAENISSKVFIRSNNYKTGSFGGIKDLQLTVANDSKYILDNVIVRLQYLKPDGEIVKEENIQFKSVSPNGTQTILVAKTNRGVKVSYKITKIESKEMGGTVAGL